MSLRRISARENWRARGSADCVDRRLVRQWATEEFSAVSLTRLLARTASPILRSALSRNVPGSTVISGEQLYRPRKHEECVPVYQCSSHPVSFEHPCEMDAFRAGAVCAQFRLPPAPKNRRENEVSQLAGDPAGRSRTRTIAWRSANAGGMKIRYGNLRQGVWTVAKSWERTSFHERKIPTSIAHTAPTR